MCMHISICKAGWFFRSLPQTRRDGGAPPLKISRSLGPNLTTAVRRVGGVFQRTTCRLSGLTSMQMPDSDERRSCCEVTTNAAVCIYVCVCVCVFALHPTDY